MDSIYLSSSRLIDEIQEILLPRLESSQLSHDEVNTNAIEAEIELKLNQISANCDKLDIIVNKEPASHRAQAKMRLDQLRYDAKHLASALQNLKHRRLQKQHEERQRQELLTRRFTTNADTNIAINDYYVDENSKLKNFHSNVDQLIDHGSNIIRSLRDQRGVLKGAQRRIIDIANTLGLSNTVMRLIEKRSYGDKMILFGGMFVFSVAMFLIWKYFT